ncbi:hypothetical protein E2C01_080508 [Portunus trituberculatus]
MKIPT